MSDYDEVRNWHKSVMLEDLSGKLKKRDFKALIINSADEIRDYVLKTIPADASVGLGGSATVRELEIDRLLKERGNTLFNHWDKSLSPEQNLNARRKQLTSDYFLTSLNAITMAGQLVNIDGIGNRTASMIFGPSHVIAIAGSNKIVKNVDEAIKHIKNNTTPKNAKRLKYDTPCAEKGYCLECKPPKTICRVTTIIDYRPSLSDFTVVLTPLELGF